jgi:5'-AMP-activated protein kinase, regulatory gamma subunit
VINCSSYVLDLGAHMRRASAELAERRRASLGSRGEDKKIKQSKKRVFNYIFFTAGLRADGTLDPHHAAILFRDSRGVSFCHLTLDGALERIFI